MFFWLKNKEKTKSIFICLAIFSLIVLFINTYFWQNVLVGIPWTICLFLILSIWLGEIFGYFFNSGKELKFIVGLFLTFYLIAFGLAVPIVFFKISIVYFNISLLLLTVIIYLINYFLNKRIEIPNPPASTRRRGEAGKSQIPNNAQNSNDPACADPLRQSFSEARASAGRQNSEHLEFKNCNLFENWKLEIRNYVLYLLWLIFYILGWIMIIQARTGNYVLSPWNIISKYYQIIWFALAFLLILFILSKASTKKILFLLILTSFLFHAYLPFVSENSFGVDRWRHVGAERRLMEGNVELPALIGEVEYVKIGPVSLPKVFVMPNKFSYSNQWGMTIGLSWLTGIDILKIDQYLIWFLWSIFFTLFVYKLSQLIFGKQKLSLLITFVALFCFFSLQVGGAITVPHAIGFLPFLFFLIVFFSYLKNRDKKIWPLIVFSLALLIFNYVLYLILAIEIFILGLILKGEGKAKKIILPILIILFILSLPLLDRLSGTSFFAYKPLEALKNLPQKILNFTNPISYFYYKFGENSYLPNLIKSFKWQIFFPPLIIFLTVLGLIFHSRLIRSNSSKVREIPAKILAIFLLIFLANQFISFSFMKDYRLLSLRLGNVLVLFLTIFFTAGIYWLVENICVKYHDRDKQHIFQKVVKILTIIILAIFLAGLSVTTYASGPAYGNVTKDELEVARYVDQEIMAKRSCGCQTKQQAIKESCVFDAGWRLLALEAVNGMIAGNFPTDSVDFVQKEKDDLYRQMLKNPSKDILDQTLKITNAQQCFFVANQSWLKPEVFNKIKELLGEPVIKNNAYIWQYGK